MGYWQYRSVHNDAWTYLIDHLRPDVALIQEALRPPDLDDRWTIAFEPAFPQSPDKNWGTAVMSRIPGSRLQRLSELADLPDVLTTRLDRWCPSMLVPVQADSDLQVVSVHSPSEPINPALLEGIDVSTMRLSDAGLWVIDVAVEVLRRAVRRQPVLLGGDFNAAESLGAKHSRELFKKIVRYGLVDIHMKSQGIREQTFFRPRSGPHQIDYLMLEEPLASQVTKCWVVPRSDVADLSDHSPLVADLN